jgi:alcohol dehydrogenase class IV
MNAVYCRLYQAGFRVGSNFLPWRKPEVIEGVNSVLKLPAMIRSKGLDHILIVTDSGIAKIGLMNGLLNALENEGIHYIIYDKTVPNPTIDNIEEALLMYKANQCTALIAFGGGSSMDCAKAVGARVARPNKSIPQMKGILKVHKTIPTLFAVPTTAGTGSETTIAAVVTNSKTHEKYPLNDMWLIPHYAILDPMLTTGLPPHITSTTGMDALTHAVEAYIGQSNTKETIQYSRQAVKLIFDNLYEAYSNGTNIEARTEMLRASHYAGIAFTRAYVGYVHAIAHTLGGFYGVPHGLANAVILPYVLDYFGDSVYKPLSELADLVGITAPTDTAQIKAEKFIAAVKDMNARMAIPTGIEGIKASDVPLMVERALQEAHPLYPVPRLFDRADMLRLYQMISV